MAIQRDAGRRAHGGQHCHTSVPHFALGCRFAGLLKLKLIAVPALCGTEVPFWAKDAVTVTKQNLSCSGCKDDSQSCALHMA